MNGLIVTFLLILTTGISAQPNWWDALNDPIISQLAPKIASSNLDVKQAKFKIDALKSQSKVIKSGLFPQVSAIGSASRGNTLSLQDTNITKIGVQAQWPLDVFGGTEAAVKAADARVEGAEADYQNIQSNSIAELALAVITWRDNMLSIAEMTQQINHLTTQVTMVEAQFKAGIVNSMTLKDVENRLAQSLALLPLYQNAADSAQFQIEQLTTLTNLQLKEILQSTKAHNIAVPIASEWQLVEILKNRPDVYSARASLLAAKQDLAEAESTLWPTVSIDAQYSRQEASELIFIPNTELWQTGLNLSYPLINFGKIKNKINSADAQTQVLVNRYQLVLAKACQDIQSSASTYTARLESAKNWQKNAENAKSMSQFSHEQYKAGMIDLATYSSIEANKYLANQNAIHANAEAAKAFIRLQQTQIQIQ